MADDHARAVRTTLTLFPPAPKRSPVSLPPAAAAAGLAVAATLPAFARYRRRADVDVDWPAVRRALARSTAVLVALVALVAALGSPADLGLRVPSVGTLVDGALYGFIAFAGSMLLVALVGRRRGGVSADPATLALLEQPASRRLLVAVASATVESLVYYGFVVEAVRGLGGGPWLAGAAAVVGVLTARSRWGTASALQWLPGSVVLAGVALATRSALVVLAIRLLYDVVTTLSGDAEDYRAAAEGD